jgi:hypothetical protein
LLPATVGPPVLPEPLDAGGSGTCAGGSGTCAGGSGTCAGGVKPPWSEPCGGVLLEPSVELESWELEPPVLEVLVLDVSVLELLDSCEPEPELLSESELELDPLSEDRAFAPEPLSDAELGWSSELELSELELSWLEPDLSESELPESEFDSLELESDEPESESDALEPESDESELESELLLSDPSEDFSTDADSADAACAWVAITLNTSRQPHTIAASRTARRAAVSRRARCMVSMPVTSRRASNQRG